MVGTTGFEPTTSSTPTKRATKLRYVPMTTTSIIHAHEVFVKPYFSGFKAILYPLNYIDRHTEQANKRRFTVIFAKNKGTCIKITKEVDGMSERKERMFWLTLGQDHRNKGASYEDIARHTASILRALKRRAKKQNWQYILHGTISNMHVSESALHKFDEFGIAITEQDMQQYAGEYHVHILILACPASTIVDFIADRWKYGVTKRIDPEHGSIDIQPVTRTPKRILQYIDDNHRYGTRSKWISQRYPTTGRLNREDARRYILTSSYGHTIAGTDTTQSLNAQGIEPCFRASQ